jgi:hypothetical protein
MSFVSRLSVLLLSSIALAASGCGDDDDAAVPDGGDTDTDSDTDTDTGPPPDPGAEFDPFCQGADWDANLEPADPHAFGGDYSGVYNTFPVGTLETMKVIPAHPFHVTKIHAAFSGSGTARIRVMRTFGRSYPDTGGEGGDLTAPIEVVLDGASPQDWLEIDVSDRGIYLLPTEHYAVVYEHLAAAPFLAIEEVCEGDFSRALIIIPGELYPYGVDGNYRLRLAGEYFCRWDEADRWFGEDVTQPFVDDNSQRVAVADVDNDGHEDLILNAGGPLAYLGDGAGGFAAPAFDPFPDVPKATMLVFGDLDNDGFQDAFAATYVAADNDGDGVTVGDGDCNDANIDVYPGAEEVAGNGLDDDCDLVADDGTDTSDADGDGFSIADGDCDDTRADVFPGAPELLDSRDNDCDGVVDEDFVNTVLLGDGSGAFALVPASGVELLDPSAAAALGDGNGDGFLDVYWGNWLKHYPESPAVADVYATGNGDGTFSVATAAAGVTSILGPKPCYGVLWGDYNNDGRPDIWVGNYGYEPNFLFHNLGDGTFIESGEFLGVHMDTVGGQGGNTFGGDFGDVNNDGYLDLYAASIAHPRYQPWSDPSTMLINQGPPEYRFVNMRAELGLHYDEGDVNAAFADFDNDMDLDLAVLSLYGGHFSRLYLNDGQGGFTDVTYQANVAVNDSVSGVWLDIDEDGDLDLVIADRAGAPYIHLFVNRRGSENAWVQLVLEGTATNRDGVGARVTVEAGGVSQIREVKGGGGHSNTQQSKVVHFGLGGESSITSATVRWVGGATETVTGLQPNHRYRVVEGSGTGVVIF